ncbi:MAG: type III pantothenate kinase [Nitrospirae bacterium]|nr:type III pantothenate kinase [Nitrospirota bacterium]
MLLLIDIGNTTITIGLYNRNKIKKVLRIKTIAGGRDTLEYEYILKGFISDLNLRKPAGAAVCSVVPEVTPLMIKALKAGFGVRPVNVSHKARTGLKYLIKNKGELGEDRIANAAAAHKLYKGNLIVVDFGTATTFCVITEKGEYTGGAIMPGLGLSAKALAEKTSKLPLIELKAPESAIGKDTGENIRSGVILGHAGAAERIIREIKTETGKEYKVLATGGYAGAVTSYIRTIDYVDPLLTLEGLRIIYEMNS